MQEHPISESELSRQTSISQPVINRILKGVTTNPNIDTLRPIAKFFSVSVGQLIGDEPLTAVEEKNVHNGLTSKIEWTNVPIISWIEPHNYLKNRKIEKSKFIYLNTKLSEHAYALTLEDTTMEPTFLKGTIIVVEPKLEPIDQEYVIVALKGQKSII